LFPRVAGRFAAPTMALTTALVGIAGFAASPARADDAVPAMSPVTRLAAVVQPVVVSLTTTYQGRLEIRVPVDNKSALNELKLSLWAQQRSGKLARDLQSINRQWLSIWASNPDKYSKPGRTVVAHAKLKSLCSGWFATPDGYLISGAHCVTMSRKDQLAEFKSEVLPQLIEKDYKKSIKNFQHDHVPLDQDMLSKLHRISSVFYTDHTKLTSTSTTVSVALAVKGKTLERDSKTVPAEVVSAGKPYPGRDVALLKVNGYQNLPSLALGDERKLQVGDRLFVAGFPGTVAVNPAFSASSRKEPTFTEGLLNASRTTTKGVPYLQTQAPATHGNSGGPVLDDAGRVVGILIAGSVDDNGQLVAGQEFVLPASEVASELAGHGLKATSAPDTTLYSAALTDYSRGYYKRALVGFTKVQEFFPEHPYAAHYASLAQQRISAGDDRTPKPFPWGLVAAGVIGALLVLAVSAFALIRRRRRPADGAPISPEPPTEPIPVSVAALLPPPAVTAPPPPVVTVQPLPVVEPSVAQPPPTRPGVDTPFAPP
jgi:serine protease Do